jgi:beta-glucosidase
VCIVGISLPFQTFAVIGFGSDNAVVHGGGSGSVVASYTAKPIDGIRHAAGGKANVTYDDGTDLNAASVAAAAADYAIVFVGTLSHEGGDRTSLSLDDGCDPNIDPHSNQCKGNNQHQNEMITTIAGVNNNTIVVASVPGGFLLRWSTLP